MLITNNYIIILIVLSLIIFYCYISSQDRNFIEKLFQMNTHTNSNHFPIYSKKINYSNIIDNQQKNLNAQVVKHDIYDKLIFNDILLNEINSIMIPIISKLNNTLGTRYNKEYIDYKNSVNNDILQSQLIKAKNYFRINLEAR